MSVAPRKKKAEQVDWTKLIPLISIILLIAEIKGISFQQEVILTISLFSAMSPECM